MNEPSKDVETVGFFDRALTDAEVELLYNSGTGRAYPFEQSFFTVESRGW